LEADLVYERSTNIRIPFTPEEPKVVDYCAHPVTGKFVYMEIHATGRANLAGTTVAESLPVIDMSVPRRICPYDKHGGKLLVQAVKCHVFGKERIRMTKAKAEGFFGEDAKFWN